MPKLTIDNQLTDVAPGSTILEAARRIGIAIPTLCHRPNLAPCTSCFVCVVKVAGRANFSPACATLAEEGMVVQSSTPDVLEARRAALELLLSDHLGDCQAPCTSTCPAGMDIPRMIRQIAAADLAGAIATVKADIPLPATLGRICPAPCERACRRGQHDGPLAICLLKRFVADADLAGPQPYQPTPAQPSGKGVAVIGAGPAGLAAAYYLAISGHACTILDAAPTAGGAIRGLESSRLPAEVLAAEVRLIAAAGVSFRLGVQVGADLSLAQLRQEHDALVIAAGSAVGKPDNPLTPELFAAGVGISDHGARVDPHTHATTAPGIFAGGDATRRATRLAIRALADGKAIAASVDQFLTGQTVTGPQPPLPVHIGKLDADELRQFLLTCPAPDAPRQAPPAVLPTQLAESPGFAPAQAAAEAARCLHCDCRGREKCLLRLHAQALSAKPARFKSQRRRFIQDISHELVIYESGKCIACGLCVQVAQRAAESLGLTFIGRGFNVRLAVPFAHSFQQGLARAAADCAAVCPTGAIVLRQQ